MSLSEVDDPLRRTAPVERPEALTEDDGFLRANSVGDRAGAGGAESAEVIGSNPSQSGASAPEDDGFVRVERSAEPRMGDDLMAHMQPRERQGGVRGFLRDALSHDSESPELARKLARFGMGMNAEKTAGVPGIIAGQVAMNGLDVAELAGLGGPTGFTGGLTGTMRRDIGRTAGIALTAAARKAILDTGERPEDIAVDTRTKLAQAMAHRKELVAKRRAGGEVERNALGRSAVNKWTASTQHGANVEYMGHRPEFGYTMQESAGINNKKAIRRAADDGEVKFVDRKPGTELIQPDQQPGEAPIAQTDAERRKGARYQNLAAITRGGDEVGRILQNDETGLDDLYKGNYGKAIAKGGLNTVRNLGVGVASKLLPDPTRGFLAYPALDAGLKVAGAGVSAASQAIGHATGIEGKAQLQDDKDLYNTHYFGDKKGEGKPLEGFDTAREEAILRSGLRERGHADDIGSERAGLPQYDTGNAATSFLKQRLGKGLWTRWWRDVVTEPRAVGGIAAPAARGIGSTLKSVGKFAAKYTGLAFLGRKIGAALSPKYREKLRAKKAERNALISPAAPSAAAPNAAAPNAAAPSAAAPNAADPNAAQAPSLADVLAPQSPAQESGDPGLQEEEKEPDLLSQMRDLEKESAESPRASEAVSEPRPRSLNLWQEGDPEPPSRRSEAESSRAGTVPPPELRENRVGRVLEEEGAAEGAGSGGGAPHGSGSGLSAEGEEEMVRLARERHAQGEIAGEDSMLRSRLAQETKDKDTFLRNYLVGETLGFGKFDKADHNIRAWVRHFKARDRRTGQDVHSKARKHDPAGYERKRQEELERIRKRLRGEALGPTGRSMLDVVPGMADQMDREEAVRAGNDPAAARQASDLGSDFDFDDILQRYGSEAASNDPARDPARDSARATVPAAMQGIIGLEGDAPLGAAPKSASGELEEEKVPAPNPSARSGPTPGGTANDEDTRAMALAAGIDPDTGEPLRGEDPVTTTPAQALTRRQVRKNVKGGEMFHGFDTTKHLLPGEKAKARHDLGPGAREARFPAMEMLEPTDRYRKELEKELSAPEAMPREMMKASAPVPPTTAAAADPQPVEAPGGRPMNPVPPLALTDPWDPARDEQLINEEKGAPEMLRDPGVQAQPASGQPEFLDTSAVGVRRDKRLMDPREIAVMANSANPRRAAQHLPGLREAVQQAQGAETSDAATAAWTKVNAMQRKLNNRRSVDPIRAADRRMGERRDLMGERMVDVSTSHEGLDLPSAQMPDRRLDMGGDDQARIAGFEMPGDDFNMFQNADEAGRLGADMYNNPADYLDNAVEQRGEDKVRGILFRAYRAMPVRRKQLQGQFLERQREAAAGIDFGAKRVMDDSGAPTPDALAGQGPMTVDDQPVYPSVPNLDADANRDFGGSWRRQDTDQVVQRSGLLGAQGRDAFMEVHGAPIPEDQVLQPPAAGWDAEPRKPGILARNREQKMNVYRQAKQARADVVAQAYRAMRNDRQPGFVRQSAFGRQEWARLEAERKAQNDLLRKRLHQGRPHMLMANMMFGTIPDPKKPKRDPKK